MVSPEADDDEAPPELVEPLEELELLPAADVTGLEPEWVEDESLLAEVSGDEPEEPDELEEVSLVGVAVELLELEEEELDWEEEVSLVGVASVDLLPPLSEEELGLDDCEDWDCCVEVAVATTAASNTKRGSRLSSWLCWPLAQSFSRPRAILMSRSK